MAENNSAFASRRRKIASPQRPLSAEQPKEPDFWGRVAQNFNAGVRTAQRNAWTPKPDTKIEVIDSIKPWWMEGSVVRKSFNQVEDMVAPGNRQAREDQLRKPASRPTTTGRAWYSESTAAPRQDKPTEREIKLSVQREKNSSEAFTPEEYASLTDRQRSFLDAQTMLWNALQEDRATPFNYQEREQAKSNEDYQASVNAMFGEDGNSARFLPRTVAVLQELGFVDQEADLDDFANGNLFITKKQILNMKNEVPSGARDISPAQWNLGTAAMTDSISSILEQGTSLLASVQGKEDYSYADGMAPKTWSSDYSPEQLEALALLRDGMAQDVDSNELGAYYTSLQEQDGITPEMVDKFLINSLMELEQQGQPLGGEGFISIDEFRQKWGIK